VAMPDSGNPIGMDQLNVEFERYEGTLISIDKAEKGVYGSINQSSSSKPDGERPNSLSEWYSYNHSATSGWSPSKSLQFDGVNDWARMTGSSYANICQIFDSGGTIAFAFQCTGTTSYSNQYLWQGAWGGGWNWLLQCRDFSSGDFQLRFRHDFSGNNPTSEASTSSGQRPFETNKWYFVCLTYDNGSTSNKPRWYYGDYAGTSLTSVGSSPYMVTTGTGTKRSMSAQYPAISGGKGQVLRPLKGYVTMVGMWSDVLTSSEVNTLWNSGDTYKFSDHSNNLLAFHDMASLSGTTISPETGGSGYTIALTNGASQSTTIPS